jgi:hypothetical protein
VRDVGQLDDILSKLKGEPGVHRVERSAGS